MPPTKHHRHRFLPTLLLVSAVIATTFVNPAAAQDSVVVRISTALDPSLVTIEEGASITWTNVDGQEHQMRSETGPAKFDTDDLDPGVSATITFTVPGIYTYSDHHNPDNHEYQGTVVVVPVGGAPWFPSPGDGATPPAPPPPTEATVGMAGRVFRPASITVAVGATVTFFNDDGRAHTATATDLSWDSGNFDPGQSYQKTFTTAGTYPYFCVIHPDMTGTILVASDDGSTPAPPPTTTPAPVPAIPASSQEVEIIDFDYSPTALTVAAGASVTWRNTGPTPHTVTADAGSFDSGYMFTGDTFTTSFPISGNYAYYCTLHPAMRATVIVGSGGEVPDRSTSTSPDETAPAAPPTATSGGLRVAMLDNNFAPQTITVPAGSTVRWSNNGVALHTVTANDASFDSGFIESGRTYAARFSTPGTFGYVCIIHPGMTGTVLVTDSGGTTPPPQPDDSSTGSDDAQAPAAGELSSSSEPFRVDVVDLDYEPRDLTVPVGTEVLWVNTGRAPHTVTAEDDTVDSGIFMTGESFSLVFDEEGVFEYYCTLHPGMEGTVTITEGAEISFSAARVADDVTAATPDAPLASVATLDPVAGAGGANVPAIVIAAGAFLGALTLGYLAIADWMRLPQNQR